MGWVDYYIIIIIIIIIVILITRIRCLVMRARVGGGQGLCESPTTLTFAARTRLREIGWL
jgi:hypothetical protein